MPHPSQLSMALSAKKKIIKRLKEYAFGKAMESPRYAAIYYALTGNFDRECYAVLHGRMAHEDQTQKTSAEAWRFTLRRNIHRLEKGLLMKPRRPVFAEAYIGETVQAFAEVMRALRTKSGDTASEEDPLVAWGQDVLDEYFGAVTTSEKVTAQRALYDQARISVLEKVAAGDGIGTGAYGVHASPRIPYLRNTDPLPVDIEAMQALAYRRRSVRWFADTPVPREHIDKALEVAFQSPSACNRQPFVFRVFDDPEMVRHISEIPMGTAGYAHNIPVIVVIVGRQRAYFSERDRHLIYIDGSLAAMSFMFGLEVQGIGSCPINWPDIEDRERKMAKALKLAPDERPIMLVALGYPDPEGAVAYSQKKPLDEARTYNQATI